MKSLCDLCVLCGFIFYIIMTKTLALCVKTVFQLISAGLFVLLLRSRFNFAFSLIEVSFDFLSCLDSVSEPN